jgi:hypothetical protein
MNFPANFSWTLVIFVVQYFCKELRELAPAFLFPGSIRAFAKSKTTEIAPFRIKELRNAIFVTPFF